MKNIVNLYELISKAKHAIVLTGAGISTLSGIPDFRGVGGLYSRKDIDAHKLFDIDYFSKDPSYYYINTKNFFYGEAAEPNLVHKVLAKLEEKDFIKAIITQNIDALHQKAGSKTVFELHGSPLVHTCLKCHKEYDFKTILSMIEEKPVPYCIKCAGIIKPNVVFFGEQIPIHALQMAEEHAHKADLILVLGTSLTVYPAAAIPQIAMQSGAKVAIVNASSTYVDDFAIYSAKDLAKEFNKLKKII